MQDQIPLDGEFGLDYQIVVMRKMIQQLPKDLQEILEGQLDTIVEAYITRSLILHQKVTSDLADVRLSILNMEFDLTATKNERDALKERLGE